MWNRNAMVIAGLIKRTNWEQLGWIKTIPLNETFLV